jgi:flagellar biosynthesis/type III secretory pathway protein FliH
MVEKEKILSELDKVEEENNKPLSDQEISSLIKASKDNKFNAVELKVKHKENKSFKKVSLHDIAKKANIGESKATIDTISKEKEGLTKNKVLTEEINDDKKNEKIEEKLINEEDHLEAVEKEKKLAYEKGKLDALNEIKEGSEAAIAQLKKVTETISKVDELDLKNIETLLVEKVLELSSDLSGKIIKALPTEFIKKITKLVSQLENIEGNIEIFINEEDLNVIESDKNIKKNIKKLNLFSKSDLKSGEVELKVNGITVSQKV